MTWVEETLDASTLERWVRPEKITADVVRLGIARRYLTNLDAIRLMLRRMDAGIALSGAEIEIALLLSDDSERVSALLDDCNPSSDDAALVWLYVGVKELRERWDAAYRPWDQVADLVETAGRPDPWGGLVYYDPVPIFHRPKGLDALAAELDQAIAECDASLGFG